MRSQPLAETDEAGMEPASGGSLSFSPTYRRTL
jgi:hypothetical protein